jgi:hypothetical protein
VVDATKDFCDKQMKFAAYRLRGVIAIEMAEVVYEETGAWFHPDFFLDKLEKSDA